MSRPVRTACNRCGLELLSCTIGLDRPLGLDMEESGKITNVADGGQAAAEGVLEGMCVVAANKEAITSFGQLRQLISRLKSEGRSLEVHFQQPSSGIGHSKGKGGSQRD